MENLKVIEAVESTVASAFNIRIRDGKAERPCKRYWSHHIHKKAMKDVGVILNGNYRNVWIKEFAVAPPLSLAQVSIDYMAFADSADFTVAEPPEPQVSFLGRILKKKEKSYKLKDRYFRDMNEASGVACPLVILGQRCKDSMAFSEKQALPDDPGWILHRPGVAEALQKLEVAVIVSELVYSIEGAGKIYACLILEPSKSLSGEELSDEINNWLSEEGGKASTIFPKLHKLSKEGKVLVILPIESKLESGQGSRSNDDLIKST